VLTERWQRWNAETSAFYK